MNGIVYKTGANMFDAFHAYGLCIVTANGFGKDVTIEDSGSYYTISCQTDRIPQTSTNLLETILVIPDEAQLKAQEVNAKEVNDKEVEAMTSLSNLDGLLAALFTVHGIRAVSVADTYAKIKFDNQAIKKVREKVLAAISRWQKYIEMNSSPNKNWFCDLLEDYKLNSPQIPSLVIKREGMLSITMPLDPAFSLSSNRWVSDGLICKRSNTSIEGYRFAVPLAYIGAARFLRAQKVSGDEVNFYVPLPQKMTVSGSTAMPRLRYTDSSPIQACLYQWLKLGLENDDQWHSLAYQTMQVQGVQQSISVGRGTIPFEKITALKERYGGRKTVLDWLSILKPTTQLPLEITDLVDLLISFDIPSWLSYLENLALVAAQSSNYARSFKYEEVRMVTEIINCNRQSNLATLLLREGGTLQFGRALRLLGKQRPTDLKDILYDLQATRDIDRLMIVLTNALQFCAVAKAKSEFIIIPTESDLYDLLEDIAQFGLHNISTLLIILSAVRYPKTQEQDDANDDDDGIGDGIHE